MPTWRRRDAIQEYIRAGDCYQVVPSRRVARPTRAHPFAVYRALRSINPSPYMFYLALDDFAVAGASPELLVRVEEGEVAMHPIAGTRRRDADPRSGRRAGGGATRRREGARRASDAGGPGAQRRGASERAGQRARHPVYGGGALLACHAPGLARHGRVARRPHALRRAAGGLPRRDGLWRAQDARDADHRRARGAAAWRLRRRGGLHRLRRQRWIPASPSAR